MNDILSHLNSTQQEAVTFNGGSLLILAGAGSGKTRALTHRAAWLITERRIPPEDILMLTFTNKAAEEMKERLKKLLINTNKLPLAGTFHSFCARILRIDGHHLHLPKNYSIYDEDDQLKTIKLAMTQINLSPKRFKPGIILNTISQAKNELISALEYPQYVQGDYQTTVARIYLTYQRLLRASNALDFDDLLFETVRLFQKEKSVLEKYQDRYRWILIDEYQDTNHAQYVLTKLLAKKFRNLTVVGDAAQCLPPETPILTPNSLLPIEKITKNTKVLAASGRGKIGNFPVVNTNSRLYEGDLIEIITDSKRQLKLTPNHLLFARLTPADDLYFIYLMYRRDKGYRIGTAKGKRSGDRRRGNLPTVGLFTRDNQEAADKMWVLKVCKNKKEASFWEYWFSFNYGIPTLVFDTGGRKMTIKQSQIDELYSAINTFNRAKKLMKDLQLDHRFPHHRPRGTSGNKHPDRQIVHLKFFEDKRQSLKNPWSSHRISLNTTDRKLEEEVKKAGFFTRPGRRNTWRTEILRLSYEEAEKIAIMLSRAGGDLEISREAFFGKKQKFFFHPASHIHPGMVIAVQNDGQVTGEKVISAKRKHYRGKVYDLDVGQVHNYLANGVVVHNSIYGWRGADYRNLVNLKNDFPDLKIINLEQNYRSTQVILDAANEVIKKNTTHPILNLWTTKKGGEKLTLYSAESEVHEAIFVADKILNQMADTNATRIPNITKNYSDFAILYRTNAQSRVIEEVFLKVGIPYILVGGVRFYERKEIKDCLAYLRLITNQKDKVSYQRIEKLGKGRLKKFLKFINELPAGLNTLDLLDKVLAKTEYLKSYDEKDPQDLARIENIKELRTVAAEFPDLNQFLDNVALIQQEYLPKNTASLQSQSPSDSGGRVTLMTAHAAKGTEFPIVFMVGMEEGLFPHSRSMMEKEEIEEERRLCYVAMTRAKEKLYISYSRGRYLFGERSVNPLSRFIVDIPNHLIE